MEMEEPPARPPAAELEREPGCADSGPPSARCLAHGAPQRAAGIRHSRALTGHPAPDKEREFRGYEPTAPGPRLILPSAAPSPSRAGGEQVCTAPGPALVARGVGGAPGGGVPGAGRPKSAASALCGWSPRSDDGEQAGGEGNCIVGGPLSLGSPHPPIPSSLHPSPGFPLSALRALSSGYQGWLKPCHPRPLPRGGMGLRERPELEFWEGGAHQAGVSLAP